jgi:hypothetical protein
MGLVRVLGIWSLRKRRAAFAIHAKHPEPTHAEIFRKKSDAPLIFQTGD